MNTIGVRLEDKNVWERRTPLVPDHARQLRAEHGIDIVVQSSPIRAFADDDYRQAQVRVAADLADADVVLAVKEVPIEQLAAGRAYVFFSHTIKGQPANMPMLRHVLDAKVTLIDYERVHDAQGRRLIFFGNYAGLAGMGETLWGYGQKLRCLGIDSPFAKMRRTHEYGTVDALMAGVAELGRQITADGLDPAIAPVVCGFTGYGNVSQGAQSVYDELPVREISPAELLALDAGLPDARQQVYKVVFHERHMVTPRDPAHDFDLQEYFSRGSELYAGVFDRYLPHLSMLLNAIYWTPEYPRLVTKEDARKLARDSARLKIIGDVSCDVEGSIEPTVFVTEPDAPVLAYDPVRGTATLGFAPDTLAIMAIDNLPCELPRESSTAFSDSLRGFVPALAAADFSASFHDLDLPRELKDAVVAHGGRLTPRFDYLAEHLK